MTDWSVETNAPWFRLGWTQNIAENYSWSEPGLQEEYRSVLKRNMAAVGEGFCPDCRVRLTPRTSQDGVTPGGWCSTCSALFILDQCNVWVEYARVLVSETMLP
jgi:hypothetical protein